MKSGPVWKFGVVRVLRGQGVAVELESLQVVALGPHIDFRPVGRAVPVHRASMQGAAQGDGLYRTGIAQVAQIGGVDDVSGS
jgi:hypothetical protein